MNNIKASLKLILFIFICLSIIPLQLLIILITRGSFAYYLPKIWQKFVCLIFNIKVKINGIPHRDKQTIYVSNHLSYLDIIVIGSALRASFVAKKDVASWPVFGFLSKLQQTAFISRDKADAKAGKSTLDAMLNDGKSLIIFPEGTSTDGKSVYPFKSSLFSIAFKKDLPNIMVQPITINMESIDNKDIVSQDIRDLYSWHINMETPMVEHLWRFMKSNGARISLEFHAPIKAQEQENRKTLAKLCHERVSIALKNKT